MRTIPHTNVVLAASFSKVPVFIARAKTIMGCVGAAASQFPNLSPPLATLDAQLTDLETTQAQVVAKVPGSSAARDAKAALLRASLEALRSYVQGLCDASPDHAATIAAAAGMRIATRKPVSKPVLAATLTTVPGQVALVANRTELVGQTSSGAVYSWQYSTDGGKTWVSATPTSVARTKVTGLPLLTEVSFRVSASTNKVTGAWSQAITIAVH